MSVEAGPAGAVVSRPEGLRERIKTVYDWDRIAEQYVRLFKGKP